MVVSQIMLLWPPNYAAVRSRSPNENVRKGLQDDDDDDELLIPFETLHRGTVVYSVICIPG